MKLKLGQWVKVKLSEKPPYEAVAPYDGSPGKWKIAKVIFVSDYTCTLRLPEERIGGFIFPSRVLNLVMNTWIHTSFSKKESVKMLVKTIEDSNGYEGI